ncbi:SDR family oxidoreductase [Actinomycetospora straminea]|uniref:SDR family oxidoreductase n=1 Tax=Actinomycetospora straminea TaxID=663607 RepID=A0ABP9EDV1_9PSEU|nr:SDR family oxidoreductase [Actinomycetospora straminea]MDD7934557.1 SDR family oxidoreductase [Actinomycetospora straminea]
MAPHNPTGAALRDKVLFITGAARGIGEETARRAAALGAHVAAVGMEPERLEKLVTELGPGHTWAECDVTDQESLDAAVAQTVAELGGIDVVVANAGIANHGTVATSPADVIARVMEVNLIGVSRTVSATVAEVEKRRGYVLLVSSLAAFTALPGMAAYCGAKAGVENYGNALRFELAHRGIGVGTAHMGWIDTDLVRDVKADSSTFEDTLKKLPYPLGALTSVEDCADAFLEGIAKRKRRIFVPKAVALVAAMRPLTFSSLGDLPVLAQAKTMVPRLEEQFRKTGCTFGATSAGMGKPRR